MQTGQPVSVAAYDRAILCPITSEAGAMAERGL